VYILHLACTLSVSYLASAGVCGLLGSGLDPGVVICNLMFVVTAASGIIKFMQAADKDGAHTLLHWRIAKVSVRS
jgi:hypothetical protein